jgi:uncharacterized YigZ family protein
LDSGGEATVEEQVRAHAEALKKEYFDATHHCWAMRTGVGQNELQRSNDDGEPAGTAGRPILGQILSAGLTDILVVVVRYFGGTKLGVPGLIAAYKQAAAEVIARCEVVEKTVDEHFTVCFPYASMNAVMRVVKQMAPRVGRQNFDNMCEMELFIRRCRADELRGRLLECEGTRVVVNDK